MAWSSTEGRVLALSVSRKKGVPKSNVPSAEFIAAWGIKGDAHAGNGHRQVSLLAVESMALIRAKGRDVQPGAFAENITTTGIDLSVLAIGDRISIGEVQLEVTQIGKECRDRCAIYDQVGDCVMPREGIFAAVNEGGLVRCNDTLVIQKMERQGARGLGQGL